MAIAVKKDMIGFAQAPKIYNPEIGDILSSFTASYLQEITHEDDSLEQINLDCVGVKHWEVLEMLGIDTAIRNRFVFKCPYLEQPYYNLYPMVILSDDTSKYKPLISCRFDYATDKEWYWRDDRDLCKKSPRYKQTGINRFGRLFMGSGYTTGTIITDGHGERKPFKVALDNGDWLVCFAWVWYNK